MRDLIGYALYSLVGLVGIVLVFSLFTDAESETQIDQMSNELTSFITEMRKTHRGHPQGYGTALITDATLIQSGIAPQTTAVNATTLQNSFGGNIAINGISNTQFSLDYGLVPRDVCIQVLSRMRPDERVVGVNVSSTIGTLSNTVEKTFPISLGDAAAECTAASNAIRFLVR